MFYVARPNSSKARLYLYQNYNRLKTARNASNRLRALRPIYTFLLGERDCERLLHFNLFKQCEHRWETHPDTASYPFRRRKKAASNALRISTFFDQPQLKNHLRGCSIVRGRITGMELGG